MEITLYTYIYANFKFKLIIIETKLIKWMHISEGAQVDLPSCLAYKTTEKLINLVLADTVLKGVLPSLTMVCIGTIVPLIDYVN